jgi:hypothetical protein
MLRHYPNAIGSIMALSLRLMVLGLATVPSRALAQTFDTFGHPASASIRIKPIARGATLTIKSVSGLREYPFSLTVTNYKNGYSGGEPYKMWDRKQLGTGSSVSYAAVANGYLVISVSNAGLVSLEPIAGGYRARWKPGFTSDYVFDLSLSK